MVKGIFETFVLVQSLLTTQMPFISVEYAQNSMQCGAACSEHQDCGGFNWDDDVDVPCRLIINSEFDDSTKHILKAYRRMTYRGRALYEDSTRTSLTSVSDAFSICGGIASVIHLPMNNLEKTTLAIRSQRWVPMGVLRLSETDIMWSDVTGQSYDSRDTNIFSWKENEPSDAVGKRFLIMVGSKFGSATESQEFPSFTVFCYKDEISKK